jgi:hypothetical protein
MVLENGKSGPIAMLDQTLVITYISDLEDIHLYRFTVLCVRKVLSGSCNARFFDEPPTCSGKTAARTKFPLLSTFLRVGFKKSEIEVG